MLTFIKIDTVYLALYELIHNTDSDNNRFGLRF